MRRRLLKNAGSLITVEEGGNWGRQNNIEIVPQVREDTASCEYAASREYVVSCEEAAGREDTASCDYAAILTDSGDLILPK